MPRYNHGQRCTVEMNAGHFCDAPRADDMPFPICFKHAIRLYRRMQSIVDEAQSNGLMEPVVMLDMLDEMRAKANSPQHRVYYVSVGDLIKIGMTARSRNAKSGSTPGRTCSTTSPSWRRKRQPPDIWRRRRVTMALVLYIVAFVLLLLAGLGIGYSRISFGWLGLAVITFTAFLLPHLSR